MTTLIRHYNTQLDMKKATESAKKRLASQTPDRRLILKYGWRKLILSLLGDVAGASALIAL
jgi:hypothetical protein